MSGRMVARLLVISSLAVRWRLLALGRRRHRWLGSRGRPRTRREFRVTLTAAADLNTL